MEQHSRSRPRLSFGLAATILFVITLVSYWSTQRLVQSYTAVEQTQKTLETIQYVETLLESAESSLRGYIITGDTASLTPYRYAKLMVPKKLNELDDLTARQPQPHKTLKKLNAAVKVHLGVFAQTLTLRQDSGFDAAAQLVLMQTNAAERETMERLLAQFQKEVRTQRQSRWGFTLQNAWTAKMVLIIAGGLILAVLGWVFGLWRRESSERRHAEQVTHRVETFLDSIIERIPYMILVKEAANLRLTLANKAAETWLGRSKEDLLGSNDFDLSPKEIAKESMHKDHLALQEGKLVDTPEETLSVPGQDSRILRTQKIPIPDDQGRPAFLLTISEDITSRKQAERMLEMSRDAALESARLKAEFIRNMSHEIRTPLSIVIGMTSLLLETALDNEQKRFASTVFRAAEGLSHLSKSILDFSKIEAGTFILETRELNVRQEVEAVISMLSDQAKAKGVGLACLIYNEIPAKLLGDPARLRQVMTQLIGNAVKFTERGEVVVRVTENKSNESQVWLQCRITDTGIGIPEAEQKTLFEAFRQVDGSHTRRFGGTGLGLAISKRIVELMGGDIGFESVAGQGSTFWFTIPFKKRHTQGPVVQVPSQPWARMRVLVVDENETLRQLLQEQLSSLAVASESASSARSALDLLHREHQAGRPFAVAIVDMHMLDMDAVAFARALQGDPALSGIKLLVMATSEKPLDTDLGQALGFGGWIGKPPEAKLLYERLLALLDPPDRNQQRVA